MVSAVVVWQDGFVGAIPAADDRAVAKEGAIKAVEWLFERLAEQLAAEAAGVDEKIRRNPASIFQKYRGDAALGQALTAGHFAVDEFDSVFARHDFEDIDEFFVFDVKGVPALDVRAAVGLARESLAVPHEGARHARAAEFFIAVITIRHGQIAPLGVELLVERVVEAPARSPQEADAQLPRRLGEFVKAFPADAEVIEEVLGKIRGRAFAHADHADLRAAHDADGDLRELAPERDGGDESGAARAEDEDVLNHGERGG